MTGWSVDIAAVNVLLCRNDCMLHSVAAAVHPAKVSPSQVFGIPSFLVYTRSCDVRLASCGQTDRVRFNRI